MKRLFSFLLSAVLLSSTCCADFPANQPTVSAASAILVDAESGRILYEKDAYSCRLIASTTKLMTALVAVESATDLSQIVTIEREDTLTEGSSMYLKAGEKVSLEGLLYGLLLHSGNDAALAIARFCAGDIDTFVDQMNQKAQELDMVDSHFANPNGLNADGHYSTAADMAKLGIACMNNVTVAKIVGTKSTAIGTRNFVNHNKLLTLYQDCVGMKTGYTQLAGRTLVSAARRGGQLLVCVTLDDPDDWKDHAALFDYGFSAYPRQVLALGNRMIGEVPVDGSLVRFVPVRTVSDVFYPLREEEQIQVQVELPERVEAPVSENVVAGRLVFSLDGQKIGETPLVFTSAVGKNLSDHEGSFFHRLFDFLP